jgi:hypothetical protein
MALSPMVLPSVSFGAGPNYLTYASFPDCALLSILGSCFSKYRVVSDIQLSYSPQTTTIDPSNFALSFSDDPNHPMVGMGAWTAGVGATNISYQSMKNSVNSVVFASWSTWSRSFKIDHTTVYYTVAAITPDITTNPMSATPPFSQSELRLSHFGSLSASANMLSATADYLPKGELFIAMELEFFDLVPITSSAIIPWGLTELMRWTSPPAIIMVDNLEEKEEKKSPTLGPRDPPTALSSGHYGAIRNSPRPRGIIAHIAGPRLKNRKQTSTTQPVRRVAMATSSPKKMTLGHVVAHLNKNRAKLPPVARKHIAQATSLAARKPSGWKKAAKTALKTLVAEVPVVGPVLGELTDALGGKLFDWIEGLF